MCGSLLTSLVAAWCVCYITPHFRRSALVEVGGWDAHNVTEDADLGLRFKRFGYRIGIITLPTLEDAPEDFRTWLPQRVRWFKGWLQTWLVHMREPHILWRELGPASFFVTQVLFLGLFVSALMHPLFLLTMLFMTAKLAFMGPLDTLETVMVAIGLVNIACGYGAFLALGMATLSPAEGKGLIRIVLLTPFHWLLLSLAATLALWEIWRHPHHWNKTPHKRARRRSPPVQRSAVEGSPMMSPSSSPITPASRPS